MRVTRFDPDGELILVPGIVTGPHRTATVPLVVDTGAAVTVISPAIIDQIGLGARQGLARTTMRSAVAEEAGYLIRVPRFVALGYALDDFLVHAHDLPEGQGIDGLIGLNFLREFDYHVHSRRGEIWLDPV